jgi:hypothetical protein
MGQMAKGRNEIKGRGEDENTNRMLKVGKMNLGDYER